MTTDQRFASAGAWILILWGVGHNVVIDFLPLAFGLYLYDVDPASLEQVRQTALRFPFMGETTMYLAFYGFSIWLGASLTVFGILNLIIARSDQEQVFRRVVYVLDIALSIVFLAIAAICFFVIPVLGATLALILFSLALATSVGIRTEPRS